MAKYVVTGGAGFIGTNLVRELIGRNHEVVVLDNFSGGKFPNRIQQGATYIEGDIRNMEDLKKAMRGAEGVFHTAAVPRMPYSIEHPFETNDVNINGTLQVLIAARDFGVKRVVYSSSSSVYGRQETLPFKEDLRPAPMSPYGLQKLVGEEYCRLFSELYCLQTVCLRYFNVYGSYAEINGPYSLVIVKFLTQRKNKEPLTITGKGEYGRDFTHASDVVHANILAMESNNVGKGEAVNIGCGKAHSVSELAGLIGGEKVFIPERKGDPKRTEADNSLAKNLLGWEPQVSLESGVSLLKQEWGIT
jgi:nucleoside-diphosphate-sugar epimerase